MTGRKVSTTETPLLPTYPREMRRVVPQPGQEQPGSPALRQQDLSQGAERMAVAQTGRSFIPEAEEGLDHPPSTRRRPCPQARKLPGGQGLLPPQPRLRGRLHPHRASFQCQSTQDNPLQLHQGSLDQLVGGHRSALLAHQGKTLAQIHLQSCQRRLRTEAQMDLQAEGEGEQA